MALAYLLFIDWELQAAIANCQHLLHTHTHTPLTHTHTRTHSWIWHVLMATCYMAN